MKSLAFYLLSIGLHAAVLASPVSFLERKGGESIKVSLLTLESPDPSGTTPAGGSPEKKSGSRAHLTKPSARAARGEAKAVDRLLEMQIGSAADVNAVEQVDVSSISAITAAGSSDADPPAPTSTDGYLRSAFGAGELGSRGGPSMGSANGGGSGSGSGSASARSAQTAAPSTQARYRDTPRPDYPDQARRQGEEGRVVLRVLVDDRGTAKAVEVSRSSGSESLDQAARSAVKRWRFHPAHKGDRPIESWVNVPVDFRLTETRN